VDDVSVALEHVDLLNGLDGLDVELLQRGLELLVVGASGPVDLLDLPAGSTLAAIYRVSLEFVIAISFLSVARYQGAVVVGFRGFVIFCGAGLSKYSRRGLLTLYTHKLATTPSNDIADCSIKQLQLRIGVRTNAHRRLHARQLCLIHICGVEEG